MNRLLNSIPAGALKLGAFARPARLPQLVLAGALALTIFGSLFLMLGLRDSTRFLTPLIPDRWGGTGTGTGTGGYHDGSTPAADTPRPRPTGNHPIDKLITDARLEFNQLLGKRSLTLDQAAARYRERRGRHPPPGFDQWFAAASKMDAVVVEEFFDRIHHDINPFWGLEPREIRARAHGQPYRISVRNGTATATTPDEGEMHFRVRQWLRLVERFANHLPDLDMYMNHMDESRVMVPWDDVSKLVAAGEEALGFTPPYEATTTYHGVADVEANERYDAQWVGHDAHKFWDFTRDACPPTSPGRNISSLDTFNSTIEYPTTPVRAYTHEGYVRNFTASQDPCLQPHMRGLHGTYVEAISMSTTRSLIPMFGECKLPTNNELLIPSAMYIAEDERKDYSGGDARGGAWRDKKDAVIWRGAASGARNKADNWWHNHRHRFIQMLNGTTLSALEASVNDTTTDPDTIAPTFRLPPPQSNPYHLPAHLGAWVSTWSDVGFTTMLCHPSAPDPQNPKKNLKSCAHTDAYMRVADGLPFERMYDYKYLPDVDGNSFSGRYRAFLQSTSMPLKATLYAEWHDDRLKPWVHFVPLDNSYMDVYGVMGYFLGDLEGGEGEGGHDAEAERIAMDGQEWANRVLRVDDMVLYTWRLLLEYARVMDDGRERLAFVGDLVKR